ncbi:MAG: hypothetical protein ACE5G1_00055 [bacterium]
MIIHDIKLDGPGVKGTVVNAQLLSELLRIVIDGSQRALRVRTQGRSTARGILPNWISTSSEFEVQIVEGSTLLQITAPTLIEAGPSEFKQRELFPEIDPDLTSFDYFTDSLDAVLDGSERSNLYDRGMLKLLSGFNSVFERGIEEITFYSKGKNAVKKIQVSKSNLESFSKLEEQIPNPQQAKIAGKLDSIRHSDRTFVLQLPGNREQVKGITDFYHLEDLQDLWGKSVLVSGTVHFTPTGSILRIEADQIKSGSERDMIIWSVPPTPLKKPVSTAAFRVPQGSRSGINALIGHWPGDESDDQIEEVLEALS